MIKMIDFQNIISTIFSWFLTHGIRVVFILVGSFLINWFAQLFIRKTVKRIIGEKLGEEVKKRGRTLISIVGGTTKFIIGVIALLMILPEFGINIGGLLAGAGLVGLAVGMASKEVISDFIAGIFIILEDQYQVGDKVKIGGVEGEVKEITLRKTIIKDEKGMIHLIPNGQIKVVAKKINSKRETL